MLSELCFLMTVSFLFGIASSVLIVMGIHIRDPPSETPLLCYSLLSSTF